MMAKAVAHHTSAGELTICRVCASVTQLILWLIRSIHSCRWLWVCAEIFGMNTTTLQCVGWFFFFVSYIRVKDHEWFAMCFDWREKTLLVKSLTFCCCEITCRSIAIVFIDEIDAIATKVFFFFLDFGYRVLFNKSPNFVVTWNRDLTRKLVPIEKCNVFYWNFWIRFVLFVLFVSCFGFSHAKQRRDRIYVSIFDPRSLYLLDPLSNFLFVSCLWFCICCSTFVFSFVFL